MDKPPVTIKEILDTIDNNLDTLTPRQTSDYSIKLASLFYNLSQTSALWEMEYAQVYNKIRETTPTDKTAEMQAKATPEYFQKRKLENEMKGLKECIQALKKRLSVLSDEGKNLY